MNVTSWLCGNSNCRMVELTDHSIGKFGTMWRRVGKICGWCRCYGEITPASNSVLYWRLTCENLESMIVFVGNWSIVPCHPSIDNLFESFLKYLFISHTDEPLNTFGRAEFFLNTPEFKNLVSDSFQELELKLTMMGV